MLTGFCYLERFEKMMSVAGENDVSLCGDSDNNNASSQENKTNNFV